MNYEPLDSLPYIDKDITDEERAQVEQLIVEEQVNTDISQTHPQVEEVYPLPPTSSLISGFTDKQLESEAFTLGGVDLERYSDLEDTENLQKSIAFTHLREVSLKLQLQFGKNQWLVSNEETSQVNELIRDDVSRKRRRIQEVNIERKQMQTEVKPVVDYLQERWVQGVQKNIDLGVEILKAKHGVAE